MGLHLCPIEPDDWTNGPRDNDGDECPDCGGTGVFSREEGFIDGLYYPAIHDETCGRCNGSGVVEPPDYEPEMSDFV